jgi:glycosyltransferase involved in cell wall biosynthesis
MVESRPQRDDANNPRISVVIPALNEAENLPHVFTRLPDDIYEVILVDGHSVDGTLGVARQLRRNVRLIRQSGRGKGNALACGFAAARGDIIVTLDADGSADPQEIPSFVAALLAGADFAKGSRFLPGGGSCDITWVRAIGNRFLTTVVNILYNSQFTDLCYGFNAFRRSCLDQLVIDCDGFEVETLMNIRVAKSKLKVAEVASHEACRINGVSNLHALPDGWRVLKTIFRERVRGAVDPVLIAFNEIPHSWDGAERRTGRDARRRNTAPCSGVERRSGLDRRATPTHGSWAIHD